MRNSMACCLANGSTNAVYLGIRYENNKKQQAKHMYQHEQQIRKNDVIIFMQRQLLKRSTHLAVSRSLTQAKERGLEHIPETIMSLTYRGLKYNQHKEVVEKDHVKLTYRGKSYQN